MDSKTDTLKIEGMSCQHCVGAVRKALEQTDGVTVDDVHIGEARVRYTGERDRLDKAVEDAGFTVTN